MSSSLDTFAFIAQFYVSIIAQSKAAYETIFIYFMNIITSNSDNVRKLTFLL